MPSRKGHAPKKGDPQRKGWADALMQARLELGAAYSDAILYDAAGVRIGVMDRVTRARRLDREATR